MFDGGVWAPTDLSGRFVAIKAHGTGQPLIVVHPAIGEPLSLWSLGVSDVLCPIIGIRAVGLDEGEPPLTPMERIGDRYLNDLVAAGIGPPYILGGYSMGGLVALEMARQLVEAGQPVKLLIIFDTAVPGLRPDHSRDLLDADLSLVRRHRLELLLGELHSRTGRHLTTGASYVDVHRILREEGVLEPATTLDRFIRIQEVWCHNTYSALRYVCTPVPVDTVYFRGTRTSGSDRQRDYWAELQRGHIAFVEHAEDHDTLMRSPAVGRDLVELLARLS
jgi:thioesterase domain-containing protein